MEYLCPEQGIKRPCSQKNNFQLLIFLLCLNLLLPALLMTGLNHSFTSRLMELGAAFEKGGIDELKAPAPRCGKG